MSCIKNPFVDFCFFLIFFKHQLIILIPDMVIRPWLHSVTKTMWTTGDDNGLAGTTRKPKFLYREEDTAFGDSCR